MSEPVKTEPDDSQDQLDGRESPSFEGLLDPDTVDGEKQEPKGVSVKSRNKIMGAAALAVLLIVGVSVVAWHFTKQEPDVISAFHSSEIKHGCVTGCTDSGNDVGGCDGKLISDPPFARGDIEKVDTDDFSAYWLIQANKNSNKARTSHIKIEGTCCWEIADRNGETQEFGLSQEGEPKIAYIKTIKTKKCA